MFQGCLSKRRQCLTGKERKSSICLQFRKVRALVLCRDILLLLLSPVFGVSMMADFVEDCVLVSHRHQLQHW